MTAARFKRLINWYPPYMGAGIRVTHVSDDFRRIRVEMRLRWYNRNYVGTHFGGSLFAMADPFLMIMAIRNLGSRLRRLGQVGHDRVPRARTRDGLGGVRPHRRRHCHNARADRDG